MTIISLPSDPASTENYSLWKKDAIIWSKLTDLSKSKQGLALQYSCKINPRVHEAVVNINPAEVECNEGFNNVMNVLDELFKVDSREEELKDYYNFENLKRKERQTIADYINEFEFLLKKFQKHGNSLSTNLLGFKLLKSANLTKTQCEIIKACSLNTDYESIKATMKKTFGESTSIEREVEEEMLPDSNRRLGHQSNGMKSFMCQSKQGKYSFDKNKRQTVPGSMYMYGRNPTDFLRRVTRCNICDSVNHWVNKCPDKNTTRNQEINLFFQSDIDVFTKGSTLVKETIGAAILDTGAAKSCTGLNWLNQYLRLLSQDDLNLVAYHSKDIFYKFGHGPQQKVTQSATFPVYIGSVKVLIEADVLQQDLPLLLSNTTLQQASAKINMKNYEVAMLGENIKLLKTSTGHCAIPITKNNIQSNKNCYIQNKVVKISNLNQTQEECRHECLPVSSEFLDSPVISSKLNEVIGIEIKLYQDTPILYILDFCTRYSVAVILKSNIAKEVIDIIDKYWISIFGRPSNIISNSLELFYGDAFKTIAVTLRVNENMTPVEKLWSHQQCQILSQETSGKIRKITNEINCPLTIAVAWAINANNSEVNNTLSSPAQLVFGLNLILPSVLGYKPPLLSNQAYDNLLNRHLCHQKAARRAFMLKESSRNTKKNLVTCNQLERDNKFEIEKCIKDEKGGQIDEKRDLKVEETEPNTFKQPNFLRKVIDRSETKTDKSNMFNSMFTNLWNKFYSCDLHVKPKVKEKESSRSNQYRAKRKEGMSLWNFKRKEGMSL